MPRWLIVTGDIVPTGGTDVANLRLAEYLARTDKVEVVTHRAAPELLSNPNVSCHISRRPLGAIVLGEFFLRRDGRQAAAMLASVGGRVIVNGGNCHWPDANWVHYVHAAHRPIPAGSALRRAKTVYFHRRSLRWERNALRSARIVMCNSRLTARHVTDLIGVPQERVRVVYYGTDPEVYRPITAEERAGARATLGWDDRPWMVFVGAMGDRRKGFDVLYKAWQTVCRDSDWDVNLAVVGRGADQPVWEKQTKSDGLAERIQFLGFRTDIPYVLAACDGMVHPARYEAYGLGVHEALCRGLPAIVSADAGVAEQYPSELADLLLPDPENAADLADQLRNWRRNLDTYRHRVRALSDRLRQHTWDDMASAIRDLILANPVK